MQPSLFADAPVPAHPLLAALNPEQRRAVTTTRGPLLVLAGAGSGKTRVITHRIAWLIAEERVSPWQILAMTFTNKAASEMRERVARTVDAGVRDLWLGTFHAIGCRMLRMLAAEAGLHAGFSIYDTDDQVRTVSRVMKALELSDAVYKPRQIAQFIDQAKNQLLLPDDARLKARVASDFDAKALRIYAAYEAAMRTADAVDFGDLLLRPTLVLAQHPGLRQAWCQRFRYVLVDEFQDTNLAQLELLKLLTADHHNLCVVGDDDQSIYSWRGAQIANILDFPRMFPQTTVVKLERNYRSSGNILAAATAVVSHNIGRHGKVLWTEAGDGELLTQHTAQDEREEADWIARTIDAQRLSGTSLAQMAVFYRTNAQSRLLEESMRRFGLPYVLIGGQRFYERAEVKDALAWCRLLVNPQDSAAWERAIHAPKRGIGAATVDLVAQRARALGVALPQAADELLAQRQAGRAAEKLQAFQDTVRDLRQQAIGVRADSVGATVLRVSGIQAALQAAKDPEAEDRLANLEQLLLAMAEHVEMAEDVTLQGFLEQVALVADTDKLSSAAKVSLMTMHSAKGLEFDVVFVAGLERGILPHANAAAGSDERDVEEERRLFYVAMTRARKLLFLTLARVRRRFGGPELPSEPSPFLAQIPRERLRLLGATHGGWARPDWATLGGGRRTMGGGPASRTDAEPEFQRDNPDAPFQPGSWVQHASFGRGQVLEAVGYGGDAKLTVRFGPATGVKKLVARFVRGA